MLKLTTEIPRRKILQLIYAAYFLGYEHHAKHILLTHEESIETRKLLNNLVEINL